MTPGQPSKYSILQWLHPPKTIVEKRVCRRRISQRKASLNGHQQKSKKNLVHNSQTVGTFLSDTEGLTGQIPQCL
uniref:Ovule protein n=1 Tax=Caenorhabditis tropicalis TaxID=1561998 RepID=A0A1I7U8Q2_9PELO